MNRSKKIRVLAALGSLSGAVWAGTFATFTDDATSTVAFTSGTVDLVLDADTDDDHAFTSLAMTNLKPGDEEVAALTVNNPSTTTALPFTYAMSSAATNADSKNLRDRLTLAAISVADTAACTAAGASTLAWNTAAAVPGASVIPSGALSAAAISSRPLAAGASEVLCFKVTMPNGTPAADNVYQGAATTATFSFTATQQ